MDCTSRLLTLFIAFGNLLAVHPVFAQLEWRVSVKFILNSDGQRPGEVGNPDPNCQSLHGSAISCDSEVREKFAYANQVLALTGRGYQFRVIEITETDQLTNYFDCPGCGGDIGYQQVRTELETLVRGEPNRYKWREDALNIYIHNRPIGGRSNTRNPGDPAPLTLIGQNRDGGIVRSIHEMGHALGLNHTHGPGPRCDAPEDDNCETPGDDCLEDTLPDIQCEGADKIAMLNFGQTYFDLDCAKRTRVLDVFYNVMSYHRDDGENWACTEVPAVPVSCNDIPLPDYCRHRFTADQLDRMTDRSNRFWPLIASGRTWFVDANTPCELGDGSPNCGGFDVLGPYKTLADGVTNAAPRDIVLLRGGSYRNAITITKRLTLRASRGNAVVGAP